VINTTQDTYLRRLVDLCRDGHRGSATAHEKRAAEYLMGELREMGLSPTAEPFFGCQSAALRYLVHIAVAVAGMAFLWSSPVVACALVALSLASLLIEQSTRGVWLSQPLMRSPSQNVAATIPSTSPTAARLILSAHYDTQRTGRMWKLLKHFAPILWHLPTFLQSPLLFLAGIMIAQLALGAAAFIYGAGSIITAAAAVTLFPLVLFAWLFWESYRSPAVPGAADNASGVAGVLALTEAWLREPIDGIELIVVLTGCEETGLLGASVWLDRHLDAMKDKPLAFLNLDGIAFGPCRYLVHETPGCGLPIRFEEPFLALAEAVTTHHGCVEARVNALPGPTDGFAFLARGVQGMTVVGCQDGGALPHYHTPQDVPENIDGAVAWKNVGIAWDLLGVLSRKMNRTEELLRA
jgi:hypothetical protein